MAVLLELRTVKRPDIIIDDTIDDSIMSPEKLKEAKEWFDKHPVPAWIFLHKYSEIQQKEGICVDGTFKSTDMEAGTFLLNVTLNDNAESNYKIRTTPEILNKIVKNYLNKPISVQIRPQINADNKFEYELIEVNE
jgi:hypothetical protein